MRKPLSRLCSQTALSHSNSRSLAAPDVVDEYVEPPLLRADALDQFAHLVGNEMIDRHGNALAARSRDKLGGFFDGFGPLVFGLAFSRRAAGDVDRRAGRAQLHCDSPARSARCARNQRHLAFQGHAVLHIGVSISGARPLASPGEIIYKQLFTYKRESRCPEQKRSPISKCWQPPTG